MSAIVDHSTHPILPTPTAPGPSAPGPSAPVAPHRPSRPLSVTLAGGFYLIAGLLSLKQSLTLPEVIPSWGVTALLLLGVVGWASLRVLRSPGRGRRAYFITCVVSSLLLVAGGIIWFGMASHGRLTISAMLGLNTGYSLTLIGWAVLLLAGHPTVRWLFIAYHGLTVVAGAIFALTMAGQMGRAVSGGELAVIGCVMIIALGVPVLLIRAVRNTPARAWFGLTCPRCGGTHTEGDLGYAQMRCHDCQIEWPHGARDQITPLGGGESSAPTPGSA